MWESQFKFCTGLSKLCLSASLWRSNSSLNYFLWLTISLFSLHVYSGIKFIFNDFLFSPRQTNPNIGRLLECIYVSYLNSWNFSYAIFITNTYWKKIFWDKNIILRRRNLAGFLKKKKNRNNGLWKIVRCPDEWRGKTEQRDVEGEKKESNRKERELNK